MEKKHILSIDVSKYYNNQLCPTCGKESKNVDNDETYAQYVINSKERFGDKSLPLCENCFCEIELCEICLLPFTLWSSRINFSELLYLESTYVIEQSRLDHICVQCAQKDKNKQVVDENKKQCENDRNLIIAAFKCVSEGKDVSWSSGDAAPHIIEKKAGMS